MIPSGANSSVNVLAGESPRRHFHWRILTASQDSIQAQGPPPLPPTGGRPAPNPYSEALDKYFDQGYNYCDAKVLGAYWGISPDDAKFRLGSKMLHHGPADGQVHIRNARTIALRKPVKDMPVWFSDGGYRFGDAELLGKFWGRGTWEAKLKMTRLLVGGNDAAIKAALKAAGSRPDAGPPPPPPPRPGERAALDKFYSQGYNFIDAKVLGAFWGESAHDAKYRLGQKMLAHGPDDGALHIHNARTAALRKSVSEMPVWFTDGGYKFDDAVVLGKYWGGGTGEAKHKMTRFLIEGKDQVIKAALKAAKGAHTGRPDTPPPLPRNRAAFDNFHSQGYDYLDAVVLGSFWGQSPLSSKYRLGQKMLDFGPDDGALHVRNARAAVLRKPTDQWPIWIEDGGYTIDDAVALSRFWRRNVLETKTQMSRLLIEGRDDAIKAALRAAGR